MTGRKKMVIGWTVFGLVWVVIFAVMEGYALTHDDAITLSQFTVNIIYAWPPISVLVGMVIGGLIVHFMWPWVPAQRRETCAVCGKQVLKDMVSG